MRNDAHPMTSSRSGYGLIIIAALFTAFAVVAATAIDRNNVQGELKRQIQAQEQLSRLTLALAKYAKFNGGVFPCPASYLQGPSSGTFGAPAATNCHSGTGAAPAGTVVYSNMISGMVPVRPLIAYGVSLNDAFDPWGSRVIFNVHRDLTTGGTPGAVTDGARIAVNEYNTAQTMLPKPDFVLVSFGRDRVGGRLRNQSVLTNPAISCGATERRYLNCDGNMDFYSGPLMTSSQAAATTYFDDTISAYRYN